MHWPLLGKVPKAHHRSLSLSLSNQYRWRRLLGGVLALRLALYLVSRYKIISLLRGSASDSQSAISGLLFAYRSIRG
jgi:hypothetical protein